jgi:prophage regulatory protein
MTRRQTSIRQHVQNFDQEPATSPRRSDARGPAEPYQALQERGQHSAVESAARNVPRLLRFPDVRSRTGLSRSTIWRLERQGGFPRHRRISANAVAWSEDEVLAWIRIKIAT